MLYLVNDKSDEILGKWNAWYINAEKECSDFIKKAGYRIVSVKITLMGDKIVRVR